MATRHRHTAAQIAAKLEMADEMAAQGRLHGDIARTLGVSLMTYHRWRKARSAQTGPLRLAPDVTPATVAADHQQGTQIRELQYENSRLRRLVADLLLEKVKLEEDLRGNAFNRKTAGSN